MADYTLYYWPIQFPWANSFGLFWLYVDCLLGRAGFDETLAQRVRKPGAPSWARIWAPVLTDQWPEHPPVPVPAILPTRWKKHGAFDRKFGA